MTRTCLLLPLCLLAASASAAIDLIHVDDFEEHCGQLLVSESFPDNGGNWPPLWSELAGSAQVAIQATIDAVDTAEVEAALLPAVDLVTPCL